MTATLDDVTSRKKTGELTAAEQAAEGLVRRAREQGISLTGPDGLLKQLTKTVLETALNQELTEHLGHEKNGTPDPETGNVRNGTRPKTVLTESSGQVQIEAPRDRAGTFEPQIVHKRQRRLSGVDEIVLSLYARGLTTGEISAHFEQIYGARVSKETISRITDKVLEEMADWQCRPLDAVYAAVLVDAIVVKALAYARRGDALSRCRWARASTGRQPLPALPGSSVKGLGVGELQEAGAAVSPGEESPADQAAVILTPDQRVRVFVSSTLEELAAERAAARRAIARLHLVPVWYESGARPHPPRAMYASYLAQSQVFVGIYWQRYGWVAPGMEISGLEDEFRLAAGKPMLLYLKRPAPDQEPRLADFLNGIREAGTVSYRVFATPRELERLMADDLVSCAGSFFSFDFGQ